MRPARHALATAAAACSLLLTVPASVAATCAQSGPAAPRQDLALAVVGLVNAHRTSIGLPQLAVSPALMRSALWKSNHMVALGYFDHDDPAPPIARPWNERVVACGYADASAAGENIAYGSTEPAQVMQQWLNSPGHRRNIEDAGFTQIGVGAAGPARHWTQNFGRSDAAEPAVAPPLPQADSAAMLEDGAAAVPVTTNDAGEWLHVVGVAAPPTIVAAPSADGRGLTLAPVRNFNGVATLAVRIADVVGQPAEAAVAVNVAPVNDAPRARADKALLRRGARSVSVRVLRNDSDVDGDRLRVRIIRRPRHGTARARDGRILYRPARRWRGRDSLIYEVADQAGAKARAAVRIRGARRRG